MASFHQQIRSVSNYVHLHGIKVGRNSAAPRLGTVINMTREMADGGNVFWEEGRSVPEMLPGISRVMKHDAPARLRRLGACKYVTSALSQILTIGREVA